MTACSVASMVILSPSTKRQDGAASYTVNPYHVLQVRQDATVSEITQNYRRLALWHHPGRGNITDNKELQRRAHVFEILAACYETLVYYGNEYNTCLHCLEHTPLKGEIYVGGKRMIVFGGSLDDDYEVVPTLLKASSSSHDDEQSDCRQQHEDTHRYMREGPLALLYRARHYEPFTNPYDVFEQVFGHAVFARPTPQEQLLQWSVFNDEPTTTTPSPAIWTGSTIKRKDGTVVSFTSRTLLNRRVTRTETTSIDSNGRTRVSVQVTSEELFPAEQDVIVPKRMCCQSTMEDVLLHEESSLCSWPELASPCGWLFPTAE